jgi:hypothetical protein
MVGQDARHYVQAHAGLDGSAALYRLRRESTRTKKRCAIAAEL